MTMVDTRSDDWLLSCVCCETIVPSRSYTVRVWLTRTESIPPILTETPTSAVEMCAEKHQTQYMYMDISGIIWQHEIFTFHDCKYTVITGIYLRVILQILCSKCTHLAYTRKQQNCKFKSLQIRLGSNSAKLSSHKQ